MATNQIIGQPSRDYPPFAERGEQIKNNLVAEPQQNRYYSRSQLLSVLRSEGYELTKHPPSKRSIAQRERVDANREIIRKAITNGQGSTRLSLLSKYLLEKHSLHLGTSALRRYINRIGFGWVQIAPGQFGWGPREIFTSPWSKPDQAVAGHDHSLQVWANRFLAERGATTTKQTNKGRRSHVHHINRTLGVLDIRQFSQRHMVLLRKSVNGVRPARRITIMSVMNGILKLAGVWDESFRAQPVKLGKNIAGKEFMAGWMKHRPCVRCGSLRRRVTTRKDGSKKYNGFTNLSIERIKAELEKCEVVCLRCMGRQRAGFDEDRANAIKDALLSFKLVSEIARDLTTDKATINKMAIELAATGQTCLCGEQLGHTPACDDLKAIRASAKAHRNEPPPQRSIVAAERDANLCTERPCPFSRYRDGLCQKHYREFGMAESFTDNVLEPSEFIEMGWNSPALSLVAASELRNPRLKTVRNGVYA